MSAATAIPPRTADQPSHNRPRRLHRDTQRNVVEPYQLVPPSRRPLPSPCRDAGGRAPVSTPAMPPGWKFVTGASTDDRPRWRTANGRAQPIDRWARQWRCDLRIRGYGASEMNALPPPETHPPAGSWTPHEELRPADGASSRSGRHCLVRPESPSLEVIADDGRDARSCVFRSGGSPLLTSRQRAVSSMADRRIRRHGHPPATALWNADPR
jgi:hypothetical protein